MLLADNNIIGAKVRAVMAKLMIYDDNVKGEFYVHDACIACDTCTDIAPDHFKLTQDYDHAYVDSQPITVQQKASCEEALEACPVAAIDRHDNT